MSPAIVTEVRPTAPLAVLPPAEAGPQLNHAAPDSILVLLDARRVIHADPPPQPVTVYSIGGQSISSSGNLTAVAAQVKSGKSAVVGAMTSAAITASSDADCLGFEAAPSNGKEVLLFDTEQSPFDAWSLLDRTMKRAKCASQPENLHHYYLLDLSVSQRREAVFAASLRAAENGPGVFAVFVDGVADLCEDVNDPKEANALVSDLVRLSVEIDAPVIVVLHENPAAQGTGTGKTRGHLGSQLERKAESNLRIVKDADGISTIFSEKCRRASIPQHSGPRFQWSDEMGMHISIAPERQAKADAAREKDQAELEEVFDCPAAVGGFSHKDLLTRIQETQLLAKEGARKRFDKMRKAGLIRKTTENLWVR